MASSSRQLSETEPLLGPAHAKASRPSSVTSNGSPPTRADSDSLNSASSAEDLAPPGLSPEARRGSLIKWLVFWAVVIGVVVYCVVEAFKVGGGEFDWEGAMKKAGGGVSCGAQEDWTEE